MKAGNKRRHKRLRIDRSVRVPVHLFPKMPFIGQAVPATLVNLSAGGMALSLGSSLPKSVPVKGKRIKIHFRLPGKPLQECWGKVTHAWQSSAGLTIGMKFEKCPAQLKQELETMAADNDACDRRIEQSSEAWCLPTCSFFDLCRKPIRPAATEGHSSDRIEIAIQSHEETVGRK